MFRQVRAKTRNPFKRVCGAIAIPFTSRRHRSRRVVPNGAWVNSITGSSRRGFTTGRSGRGLLTDTATPRSAGLPSSASMGYRCRISYIGSTRALVDSCLLYGEVCMGQYLRKLARAKEASIHCAIRGRVTRSALLLDYCNHRYP